MVWQTSSWNGFDVDLIIMMIFIFGMLKNPDYFCKLLIANGQQRWVYYLAYNCEGYLSVTLRVERRAGALLPLFFQKGSNGGGANLSSQYHREFHGWQDLVETNLLQLFTHLQHSEWFSTLSIIIFEVNILPNKHIGEEFCVFCIIAFPSIPLVPLPYRCFGCYLCFI